MNILEKGSLLHLSVSSWTGTAKVSTNDIEVHADKNLIKASKFLVDKENLKLIEQIRNEARNYSYKKSLPFPIPGVAFIPMGMVIEVNSKMEEYRAKFDNAIEEFATHYDSFIEIAKEGLRDLFNWKDYPTDIRDKFSFNWQFLTVGEPNPNTLSAEMYIKEKEKFLQTMESFTEEAVTLLRTEFGEMLDNLTTRLTQGKKFKEASILNLKEFMKDFKNLNIADDAELAGLIEKTEGILNGVCGDALRSNEEFKQSVAGNLVIIQKEFEQMNKGRAVNL